MKETIIKRRFRGLLALIVAFMLMFGSSLTVLAATTYYPYQLTTQNQLLSTGDVIFLSAGKLYIDGADAASNISAGTYTLSQDLYVDRYESSSDSLYMVTAQIPTSTPSGATLPSPAGGIDTNPSVPTFVPSGSGHTHTFVWTVMREATETQDGVSQLLCSGCGSVEAQQPITYFGTIINEILKAIKEAPENGTVIIDDTFLRCFSDEIVGAILARPDVTIDVRFTNKEVDYRFVIPAGQAPTDGQEWYGYLYLGALYGWQEPVKEETAVTA